MEREGVDGGRDAGDGETSLAFQQRGGGGAGRHTSQHLQVSHPPHLFRTLEEPPRELWY